MSAMIGEAAAARGIMFALANCPIAVGEAVAEEKPAVSFSIGVNAFVLAAFK